MKLVGRPHIANANQLCCHSRHACEPALPYFVYVQVTECVTVRRIVKGEGRGSAALPQRFNGGGLSKLPNHDERAFASDVFLTHRRIALIVDSAAFNKMSVI